MISTATIEEVKSRVDIVDVVGDFVTLKRSGQNYKALSPFTNEKTASFYVVPSKGIFKDFSSGKGGDAISFVMEHEGMSYTETIRYLAKKYGVEIQDELVSAEELAQQSERDGLYIIMNYAKDYYHDLLFNHEEGQSIGLSYFHERGFNDRTIRDFELGYSLNEWDHLTKEALQKGFSQTILEKAGLTIAKEGGKVYDRFRGRVIFPVHNLSGKIIAFGARILTKEKNQPKYINSPETDIYHKSNVLYGLYQAKNAIRRDDVCYLVEGYTDVISLHLAGVDNVVSSSGTALTEEQIKLIRRFTENVTVLFDGDAAGIKAALRGIDLVLKGGLNVRVVLFPDGEDPDSFSRKKGSTEFKQFLVDNQKDFISFKIDLFSADASKDPIKKADAIREIVTSIAVIPDPIKRSVYIRETSDLLKIQEPVLLTELNKILIQDRRKKEQDRMREAPPELLDPVVDIEKVSKMDLADVVQLQEKETIRLLLNYSENQLEDKQLVNFLIEELEEIEFTNPVYKGIYDAFREGAAEGKIRDSFYFMDQGDDIVKRAVAELTTIKYETSPHWSEKYHIYFPHEKEVLQEMAYSNVLRLKFRLIQKLMLDNLESLKMAKSAEEQEEFFSIHERLKSAEKELAEILGIVISK